MITTAAKCTPQNNPMALYVSYIHLFYFYYIQRCLKLDNLLHMHSNSIDPEYLRKKLGNQF